MRAKDRPQSHAQRSLHVPLSQAEFLPLQAADHHPLPATRMHPEDPRRRPRSRSGEAVPERGRNIFGAQVAAGQRLDREQNEEKGAVSVILQCVVVCILNALVILNYYCFLFL